MSLLLEEAKLLTEEPDFQGYIHDVGGRLQTSVFRPAKTDDQGRLPEPAVPVPGAMQEYPRGSQRLISLLRKLRAIPKVKKVFIRSGIRFDYVLADKNRAFLRELCEYHVSGQLKVAPEHVADAVLKRMGKPKNSVYMQFVKEYKDEQKIGKAVSGSVSDVLPSGLWTLKEAVELAEYLRDLGYAGAGTGFLSDPVHAFHLYVIPDWIPGPWKRCIRRLTPMRRQCSVP